MSRKDRLETVANQGKDTGSKKGTQETIRGRERRTIR